MILLVGVHASLLGGITTLALVELPILVRTMDEVMRLVPRDLKESTYAMGATRLELAATVVRQTLPGLVTAILLAAGESDHRGADTTIRQQSMPNLKDKD